MNAFLKTWFKCQEIDKKYIYIGFLLNLLTCALSIYLKNNTCFIWAYILYYIKVGSLDGDSNFFTYDEEIEEKNKLNINKKLVIVIFSTVALLLNFFYFEFISNPNIIEVLCILVFVFFNCLNYISTGVIFLYIYIQKINFARLNIYVIGFIMYISYSITKYVYNIFFII